MWSRKRETKKDKKENLCSVQEPSKSVFQMKVASPSSKEGKRRGRGEYLVTAGVVLGDSELRGGLKYSRGGQVRDPRNEILNTY